MKQDRRDAMIRVAAQAGRAVADFEARIPGRGGYLHPQDECLDRFIRSKAREFKSLRMRLDKDQRTSLVEAIRQRLDRKPALE
jgi:predicted RNA-binding protein YlxR (DUF448 family)